MSVNDTKQIPIDEEVDTSDTKTSQLETIIDLGKKLSIGLFSVWTSLEIYGAIVAPYFNQTGDQALQVASTLLPVVTSLGSSIIGVLIGKEVAK